MSFINYGKDGGKESHVWGYFFEIKKLFSIVLLRFENGSREAFHSHAFNSLSWVLKGELTEHLINGVTKIYTPSIFPILTKRTTFHKVSSFNRSYVLTIRGPWSDTWKENIAGKEITLTHGRKIV